MHKIPLIIPGGYLCIALTTILKINAHCFQCVRTLECSNQKRKLVILHWQRNRQLLYKNCKHKSVDTVLLQGRWNKIHWALPKTFIFLIISLYPFHTQKNHVYWKVAAQHFSLYLKSLSFFCPILLEQINLIWELTDITYDFNEKLDP